MQLKMSELRLRPTKKQEYPRIRHVDDRAFAPQAERLSSKSEKG
jgi:hypothetical protein